MNRSIDLYFPSPDIQVIAEPGRYFVASAFTLACQVHSKRDVLKNGTIDSIMYYINDGVYGQFNCKITEFKDVHPITLKSTDEEMFNSFIWGPTCDSLDLVSNLFASMSHSALTEQIMKKYSFVLGV